MKAELAIEIRRGEGAESLSTYREIETVLHPPLPGARRLFKQLTLLSPGRPPFRIAAVDHESRPQFWRQHHGQGQVRDQDESGYRRGRG